MPSIIERIRPELRKQDAEKKVKLKKRFRIFGKKIEKIVKTQLTHKPIIRAKIKSINGVRITEKQLLFDSLTGVPVKIGKNINLMKDYAPLMKLNRHEITTFFYILGRGSGTIRDMATLIKLPTIIIKKSINRLNTKNLIKKIGRLESAYIYKPTLKVRWIKRIDELNTEVPECYQTKEETTLETKRIIEFIKGIDKNSKLVETRMLKYPIYRIDITGEEKSTVFIDGITGRKVTF